MPSLVGYFTNCQNITLETDEGTCKTHFYECLRIFSLMSPCVIWWHVLLVLYGLCTSICDGRYLTDFDLLIMFYKQWKIYLSLISMEGFFPFLRHVALTQKKYDIADRSTALSLAHFYTSCMSRLITRCSQMSLFTLNIRTHSCIYSCFACACFTWGGILVYIRYRGPIFAHRDYLNTDDFDIVNNYVSGICV